MSPYRRPGEDPREHQRVYFWVGGLIVLATVAASIGVVIWSLVAW